jgi:hypothetical protein
VASSGRLQAAVAGVGNPDTPCLLACRDCSLDCLPGGLSVVSLITGANPASSRSDRRERVGRGYNVPRIEDSGVRTNRGAIRQRRHRFLLHGMVLVPPWLNSVLRCSPRLRRCSSTTRNAHRRLWPSVHPGGVGHSDAESGAVPRTTFWWANETLASRERCVHVGCKLRHRNRKSVLDKRRAGSPECGRSGQFTFHSISLIGCCSLKR